MKQFEFLEHTADIKFRAYGKSLDELFENCVLAFSEYISRGEGIKSKTKKEIKLEGQDNESLLSKFLDELIYLIDADGFVTARAKVKIVGKKLSAILYGDIVKNYNDLDQVKAATYAEMYIKKKKDKTWECQVVLDV